MMDFFASILFLFIYLAMPCGMWDLSSPSKDGTRAPFGGSVES